MYAAIEEEWRSHGGVDSFEILAQKIPMMEKVDIINNDDTIFVFSNHLYAGLQSVYLDDHVGGAYIEYHLLRRSCNEPPKNGNFLAEYKQKVPMKWKTRKRRQPFKGTLNLLSLGVWCRSTYEAPMKTYGDKVH